MDQLLHIQTEGIQIDGKDTYHFHRYEPTPYEWIEELLEALPIQKEDTFIDFGCGKGRLNFLVDYKYSCHTIGIEMNPKYYEIAVTNLETYKKKTKARIQFLLMQAEQYTVLPNDNYFYFFNPFSPQIFMSVMSNIEGSLAQAPRTAYVILYYPDAEYVDYLENQTSFELIDQIYVNKTRANDTRECFMIFRSISE